MRKAKVIKEHKNAPSLKVGDIVIIHKIDGGSSEFYTPSYISIETSSGLILQLMNYSFKEEECFFQLIDEEVQETNIDWEQRRYEIVKDYSANWKVALDTKEICERLVKFADKLIKQLKIKTCQQTH